MTQRQITLRKRKIPYTEADLPFKRLAFYPENPRVHSQFGIDEARTQEAILNRMMEMDYVKELRKEIDRDGQVNEPLYVMPVDPDDELSASSSHIVLEGNSRLAALRLPKPNTLPPPDVPCKILDFSGFDDTTKESLIFSLLGQLHIRGKKDWGAYEDAGFFHRRYKNHNISLQDVADETGIPYNTVRKAVSAYDLMAKYNDKTQSNFSYYQVYVSLPNLKKHRDNVSHLDDTVVSYIKEGKFPKAQDMRSHLPTILDDKPARKVFLDKNEDDPFGDAFAIVQQGGKDDPTYKWLKAFRQKLALRDTKGKIEQLKKGNAKSKTEYELNKIAKIATQLGPKS